MKRGIKVTSLMIGVALILGFSSLVSALDYPTRSIELVVAFSAGGSSSMGARIMAQSASEIIGKPIVIVNKPGAGGSLAGGYVAKARPDGYTLLVFNSATNGISPVILSNTGYENSDFQLIAQFGTQNWAIVAKADAPWNDIKDFVEYAKKNPGKVKSGGTPRGSTSDFFMELFKFEAGGLKIDMVPFKGGAEFMAALLGGHVHIGTPASADMRGLYDARRIKLLGIASAERDPDFPDVPTFKEQGLPRVVIQSWYGIAVPKGVPKEIVNKLKDVFAKAMQHPDTPKMLKHIGFIPTYRNAEDFAKFVEDMEQMYTRVAKQAGIKVE